MDMTRTRISFESETELFTGDTSKDNHSPGPVSWGAESLGLTREENLAEKRESVTDFQSLIVGGGGGERNWTYKYQYQLMGFEMPGNDEFWYRLFGVICGYTGCTF